MPKFTNTILLAFINVCSFAQQTGSLINKYSPTNLIPHISYVPAKSFTSQSYTGSDSVSFYGLRVASVSGFYISQQEVTNKEYREFTQYVKDSVAHSLLEHFISKTNTIDWNQKIDSKDVRLDSMMIPPEDRLTGKREIDMAKLGYELNFFGNKENIAIYPDTLVWLRDFAYSYNEPLAKKYFSHPSYNDYPVVGISLKQAMAFCQWKTDQVNKMLAKSGAAYTITVRLPTSNEWESAAFDLDKTRSLFSKSKNYNCNFGPINDKGLAIKGYKDDGYFYTAPVKSYPTGPFGLYDMKGNVSEWTSTGRDEISRVEVKPDKQKTSFVVKGGGWDSTPFYLQPGVCQFFAAQEAHCYLGFRYVIIIVAKH